MAKTKLRFKLLDFEFTNDKTELPNTKVKTASHECPNTKNDNRNGNPTQDPSEMPLTSEENIQLRIPDSIEQKTSWKKVVLAVVLATIAIIIGACTTNMSLVIEVFTKLIETL